MPLSEWQGQGSPARGFAPPITFACWFFGPAVPSSTESAGHSATNPLSRKYRWKAAINSAQRSTHLGSVAAGMITGEEGAFLCCPSRPEKTQVICGSPKEGMLESLTEKDVFLSDAFPLKSIQVNKEKLIQLWKQRWPLDSCELLLPK